MRTGADWAKTSLKNGSNSYPISDHQAKKFCGPRLAVRSYTPSDCLELPTLAPRPLSPTSEPVSSWDQIVPDQDRLLNDKPVSELDLADQDAYFGDPTAPAAEVLTAAENAVRGNTSKFVQWDSEKMRLTIQPVRIAGISSAATVGVLQDCADVGSHIRRLKSVVKQIEILRPSQVLLALASVIEDEVDDIVMHELDSGHILHLLESSMVPAATAQLLARVVGCADLNFRADLRYLPSTTELLNTAYREMLRVQLEPGKYELLWRIVGRTLQPWLSQLNRMLGLDAAIYSIPLDVLELDYLADMFITRQGAFFALDPSKVPQFVPQTTARMAVECLNCGLVLKCRTPELVQTISWPGTPQQRGRLNISTREGSSFRDPFDPISLDMQRNAEPFRLLHAESNSLQDPDLSMYYVLHPIDARNVELNDVAVDMLLNKCPEMSLRDHARVLTDVLCLRNGKLFSALQDPVVTMMSTSDAMTWAYAAQAAESAFETCLEELGLPAKCVLYEFQKRGSTSGTDFITIRYQPAAPADMIVTPEVVQSALLIFHYLLKLQNLVATHSKARNHDKLLECFNELRDSCFEIGQLEQQLSSLLNQPRPKLSEIVDGFKNMIDLADRLCTK